MEEFSKQVRMCAACPKMCRHVCPTFFAWRSESPTPHGRALLIHYELEGTREIDERGVEVLYQCLECSHCLTWCLPEIDIAKIVEKKRTELVQEGRYPKGLDEMVKSVLEQHNPFGESHDQRYEGLEVPSTPGKSVFYFTGCTAAYRERSIAEETVQLLTEMGYQVKTSPSEWCCGSPLLRTGFYDEALELARHNMELIDSLDVEEVIVTCPGCYRVLTQDYPEQGIEIEKSVKHISQVLSENLESLPPSKMGSTVTYHDPCHLGRHCGIYDEPRQVIEHFTGTELIEMEKNREDAMCCGNGAGMRTLFSGQAKKIGRERVSHAKTVGAEYLITSCPFCKNMLKEQAGQDLTVIDLPEFVRMMRKED